MQDDDLSWRIQCYALLATLLAAPPARALLADIAAIEVTTPESPMGRAWQQLVVAAGQADEASLRDEYFALFIGLSEGEVVPYGSYYQTGFLHEKPLALLRTDLARLGLERQEARREPEDHLAAEFDVMRLILSAEGTPVVSAPTFFSRHLKPWAQACLEDLSRAPSAEFYRAVAQLGLAFIHSETLRCNQVAADISVERT